MATRSKEWQGGGDYSRETINGETATIIILLGKYGISIQ